MGGRSKYAMEEEEVRSGGGGQVKHISLQSKRSSFSHHSVKLAELQLFIIYVRL